jgi:hypothetical protein
VPQIETAAFEKKNLENLDTHLLAAFPSISVKGGCPEFLYPDPLMPAFDLRIKMIADGLDSDYMRSTNFQTGETTVHWADSLGAFERRLLMDRKNKLPFNRSPRLPIKS